MTLVMGQPLSGRNTTVLLGAALAGTVLSYVVFTRRDI
jgi:hypothetical protein